MQHLRAIALSLAMLGLHSCALGTGVNTANVFEPQRGTIQLAVATEDPSIVVVEFEVDGETVGRDENGEDGWSVEFDTTKLEDGIHFIKAFGASGQTGVVLELLHNSILVSNAAPAASEAPATP